jgi:hypothetical protein
MKIQWEYDLVERPFCQQLEWLGNVPIVRLLPMTIE